jgi:hypothetical protein
MPGVIESAFDAAGITAGSWYASPATHIGHELIGAAMLILAGGGRGVPLNYAELERWTRIGFERGRVTQGRTVTGGAGTAASAFPRGLRLSEDKFAAEPNL